MGLAISLVAMEKEKVSRKYRRSAENVELNCLCVNCVYLGGSHRCGTTFVPAEEKAAITPDSKRTEDALFGTMRKR